MSNINDKIRQIAKETEPELIHIRRELHQYPELGIDLPKTHEIISRELHKIPGLKIREHAAGGYGLIAELKGKKEHGENVLLRADIDALPLEEKVESTYKSRHDGRMHACGHDGHATWLIGAAKILAQLTDEFGGCIRFAFQPGEEVGLGADTMIEEDKVLEDPKMDMAFAAHGWPSVESGKIGIVRRYAFGCVGDFNVRNIIPQDCVFGGTMRAVKREVLEKMKAELEKEIKGICQVYGTSYEADIRIHGGSVKNAPELLNGVKKSAADVLGKKSVYIIEEDNLGGENFAEYSSRVPAVYMFIGIKPEEKEAIPGLHSPEYQFDDTVLAGAAAAFANIAIHGCMGELEEN